jgi:4-diphosphocytidyl-2-C-methyl-D-erythritol kinase
VIGAAPAKINLALVVGPVRPDGMHEVSTVLQRVGLGDRLEVEPARETSVEGYTADTIVRASLDLLGAPHGWRVRIQKETPVAAGLGGGSSDAATALRLANAQLARPLDPDELHALAARVGADVPFFLRDGPQLATGDGTTLAPLALPQDFVVVLVRPYDAVKQSTADVYAAFDARRGADGFAERVAALRDALASAKTARDLAALPANDLVSSPLCAALQDEGAFRAQVSGAGPTVYGLFEDEQHATRAATALRPRGETWVTIPAWYG